MNPNPFPFRTDPHPDLSRAILKIMTTVDPQRRAITEAQTPARAAQLAWLIRVARDPKEREYLQQWDAKEKASPTTLYGTRGSKKTIPTTPPAKGKKDT